MILTPFTRFLSTELNMRPVTVRKPRLYGQTPPIQNLGTYLQKKARGRALTRAHVHVPTCTWGTWHVVHHVEETHTESHTKIWVDSVNGSHRNCTLKLLLSCSWARGQAHIQHPKRLVERERLAARSLKMSIWYKWLSGCLHKLASLCLC